jgi:hypothetical protein
MFQALSDKNKALLLVSLFLPLSFLSTALASGWLTALLFTFIQLLYLLIARYSWISAKYSFPFRISILGLLSSIVLMANLFCDHLF